MESVPRTSASATSTAPPIAMRIAPTATGAASAGAKEVYICATHPVLAGSAVEKLRKAPIKEVIVTDSIPLEGRDVPANLKALSVANLLGEAIRRIHKSESVSSLFL